jgi:hypothetical protein
VNVGITLGIISQIVFGYLAFFSVGVSGFTAECLFLFIALILGYVLTVMCASFRKHYLEKDLRSR